MHKLCLALLATFAAFAYEPQSRVLRICADPNNLPFSNQRQEGFENRIAAVLARETRSTPRVHLVGAAARLYPEHASRRLCDIVMGVPREMDMLLTTAPYYRSTYVFVTRRDRRIHVDSLDSPELRKLRIGVQTVGDDYANTPPAHALAKRGIVQNVHGYSVTADYSQPNPPARIIEAVARSEIDIAIAWGPMAGYFARQQPVALEVTPVSPQKDSPSLPLVYDISMGVRRGETAFKSEIETAIAKHRAEIRKILDDYGVPQVNHFQLGKETVAR
jgi:quinoprotein dehydrogenase-associated probable ABC transporter substrate-binding protein